MSKVFIDSNVLIYAMDKNDPRKQKVSKKFLKELAETTSGVISTQVMQEFYVAATRKLNADPLIVKSILHSFEHLEVVIVNPLMIKEAIDCSILNRLSFWDALIIIAAESANCEKVLTEDMQNGQIIRGVRIENIF